MPRLSYEDQRELVQSQIEKAGGRLRHNDLVTALESAGQAHVVPGIPRLVKTGDLEAQVVAEASSSATLWYCLPTTPTESDMVSESQVPPTPFGMSGGEG